MNQTIFCYDKGTEIEWKTTYALISIFSFIAFIAILIGVKYRDEICNKNSH
jgi:hypothetical protein